MKFKFHCCQVVAVWPHRLLQPFGVLFMVPFCVQQKFQNATFTWSPFRIIVVKGCTVSIWRLSHNNCMPHLCPFFLDINLQSIFSERKTYSTVFCSRRMSFSRADNNCFVERSSADVYKQKLNRVNYYAQETKIQWQLEQKEQSDECFVTAEFPAKNIATALKSNRLY